MMTMMKIMMKATRKKPIPMMTVTRMMITMKAMKKKQIRMTTLMKMMMITTKVMKRKAVRKTIRFTDKMPIRILNTTKVVTMVKYI